MDALIASLPDRSGEKYKGSFVVVSFMKEAEGKILPEEENVCDKNQVAAADLRGWTAREWKLSEDGKAALTPGYAGSEPVAIEEVLTEESDAVIVAIYTVDGHRIGSLQPGVNIIRLSNGAVRKVLVRP